MFTNSSFNDPMMGDSSSDDEDAAAAAKAEATEAEAEGGDDDDSSEEEAVTRRIWKPRHEVQAEFDALRARFEAAEAQQRAHEAAAREAAAPGSTPVPRTCYVPKCFVRRGKGCSLIVAMRMCLMSNSLLKFVVQNS